MTRCRKSLLLLVTLLVLASVASVVSYRAHRVTSFARQYLALDLALTPFGSSPADIPGITAYTDDASPSPGALVWYVTSGPSSRTIARYGFSNGRLTKIQVTQQGQGLGNTNQSSARLTSFLYSISPRLFYALRGDGELHVADSSFSLDSQSYCSSVRPILKVFTITPNSQ